MRISNLIDYPEFIPEILEWHYSEWGALYPELNLKDFENDLLESLSRAFIPSTWVMLSANKVIGSASILKQDMTTNTDLSPWLANIYIHQAYRGKGLGFALVKEVIGQAKHQGLNELYLFTPDQEEFYKNIGWSEIKKEVYQGKNVSIMSIKLSNQDRNSGDLISVE